MRMESFGGSMTPGRPAAVASGDRVHVFAIAGGGAMNHWTATNGGPWSGPSPLPGGNLAPSFPCAIALRDGSVHVFAIGNGGPLTWWSSADGVTWTLQLDPRVPIPGGGNGPAAASPDGRRLDAFAVSTAGIMRYSFIPGQGLPDLTPLPDSSGLHPCVLAAVSAAPGTLDVFAVDPGIGVPLRWHFDGAWSRETLAGPPLPVTRLNGFAAVSPAPGRIELFAITADGHMTNWSLDGRAVLARQLARGAWDLSDGVPAVVARATTLDVFAIGPPGGPFQGGPLAHWRFANGAWSEPVAHEAGLAAGGVGALNGAAGLEAFAFESGTDNSLQHWPAGIGAADHDPWQNWAANRRTDPVEGHCRPTCLEELVAIVSTAAQQDRRARAVGSSWSFSDIAVTPGYVVETSGLNRLIPDTVVPGALRARDATSPDPHHLVHVEAGIQLENLMMILDGVPLTLPAGTPPLLPARAPYTMGGAAGQTLAGVISTSVHGSHFRLPPFPDAVRAIHLVGPDGSQHWIEPRDRPITDEAKLQNALGPEVKIRYDDDWFDAVLVSVGSLGIVYSVVLEVRDQYKLRETRTQHTWPALRERFADYSVFSGPDGVQVAIDPGSMADPDPRCFLVIREEISMAVASSPLDTSFDPQAAFCEGDLLETIYRIAAPVVGPTILTVLGAIPGVAPLLAANLPILAPVIATDAAVPILLTILKAGGPGAVGDLLGSVLDKHPDLTAGLISAITATAQAPGSAIDIAHQVMARRNRGECAARGLALELAFDATDGSHLRFIDAAIAMLQDEAAMGRFLGGWFAVRFVGPSRAILSPQQSAMTCMIEFVGLRTLSSTKPLLDRLEALGLELGGIQHWGMFDQLKAGNVAGAYPRVNTWRQVRWDLTNGGTVHTFDNAFTSRCGLSDPPSSADPPSPAQPLSPVAFLAPLLLTEPSEPREPAVATSAIPALMPLLL